MKMAILTCAFYSEKFSKVFIGSFRKHYPDFPLVAVDNNMGNTEDELITEIGLRETAWLKTADIIYVKSEEENKSHGIGLDVGIKFLYEKNTDLVITLDIDSLFLKRGIVEWAEGKFNEGYKLGGRGGWDHTTDHWFLHPSLAFYDLKEIVDLSFEDERAEESLAATGERISDTLEERGFGIARWELKNTVAHFGGGSILRLGTRFCKHKLLGNERYEKKLEAFFERKEAKCHL